jgi:predicted porin
VTNASKAPNARRTREISTTRVPQSRDTAFRMAVGGGLAASLLWALPTQAAENVTSLLQQMRVQLDQDQAQIERLKRQLDDLQKRVGQTLVAPPPGVPAPEVQNVVVTQQPGNLPGRSVGPPNTASGIGTPGAPPPEPAAPISSARDKIKVSLSGQVDRALLYGSDGKSNAIRNVDNIISSTRFRLVGEGRVAPDTTLGTNLEMELRPNLSNQQTITQNLPQAAGNVFPTVRQAEVFLAGETWGDVRLGFGSTASYLTNEFDLSGTFIGHYVGIAEQDGGFAFRQRGAALVPAGAGRKSVLSPDGAFGPAVGSVFNNFGGLGRDDRIRYDTPVWEGLQFSTSYVDGGSYDAALRLGRTIGEFRIIAAAAGAEATHRNHAPTANLGYAGVPAGFIGGASLGGVNANPSGPNLADVSPNGSRHFDGSFSVLHDSGISFTMSGGVRDPRYLDPLGRKFSPNLLYTKLGYQHDFFPFGRTAVSVDFAKQDEVTFAGDTARSYAVALVQNIDAASTELFASAAYQTLDRTLGGSFHPIVAAWSGARVRF